MTTNKKYRHHYIIGDVQGCFGALTKLLKKIKFDESQDKLWFAGDLVARGEDSLSVLRLVKRLQQQGSADTVLGNHDLNLLAVWRGFVKLKNKDKTAAIIQAEDCHELMSWLRQQPLVHFPTQHTVLSHAGIPPIWTANQAKILSDEVTAQLKGSLVQLDQLLPALYGKLPDTWDDSLEGMARLRCITNYLTRMRLCDAYGRLEFTFKSHPTEDKDDIPDNFQAWYTWRNDITLARKEKIFFGHWAALAGDVGNKQVQSTDAGCVWGGELRAYRLTDNKIFAVS